MRYTRYSLCDYVPGDLIPRHQQVFSNNQFFCGVSIPEPQQMVWRRVLLPLFQSEKAE